MPGTSAEHGAPPAHHGPDRGVASGGPARPRKSVPQDVVRRVRVVFSHLAGGRGGGVTDGAADQEDGGTAAGEAHPPPCGDIEDLAAAGAGSAAACAKPCDHRAACSRHSDLQRCPSTAGAGAGAGRFEERDSGASLFDPRAYRETMRPLLEASNLRLVARRKHGVRKAGGQQRRLSPGVLAAGRVGSPARAARARLLAQSSLPFPIPWHGGCPLSAARPGPQRRLPGVCVETTGHAVATALCASHSPRARRRRTYSTGSTATTRRGGSTASSTGSSRRRGP